MHLIRKKCTLCRLKKHTLCAIQGFMASVIKILKIQSKNYYQSFYNVTVQIIQLLQLILNKNTIKIDVQLPIFSGAMLTFPISFWVQRLMKKDRELERVLNMPGYFPREFNVDADGFLLQSLLRVIIFLCFLMRITPQHPSSWVHHSILNPN